MRRAVRTSVAALGMAAAVLAGCTSTVAGHGTNIVAEGPSGTAASPGTSTPTLPVHSRAAFRDCTDLFNLSVLNWPGSRRDRISVGCARISVPADYADPSGKTLTVELVKVHDSQNTTGQALVVNPGGPGGSGVDLAVGLAAQVSDAVLARYDLVGFDPRGVGLSSPVSCLTDHQKDQLLSASPNVLTASGFDQAKAAAKQLADACAAKYGTTLADFSTVQTAKDIDQIREALGEDKLDYLGFSYGTELGAAYVHLFPGNVGRAVLDGAVDPYTDAITSFADQLKGFEGAFDQFAAWCRTASGCSALGDPRQAVYAVVAAANANPISAQGDSRKATSALVLTGVLSALYSKSEWRTLGEALQSARDGNAKQLLDLADEYNQRSSDGSYTNILDANTAISCNDSPPGPTDAVVRATAVKWQKAYPMFGLWSAASLFSCQAWQPERTVVPVPAAPSAPTVLVIGNLHDPATPYKGAQDLTRALGHAELLTWDGEGHTSYLQGSSCIDNDVNAYLVSGALPKAGTTCQ